MNPVCMIDRVDQRNSFSGFGGMNSITHDMQNLQLDEGSRHSPDYGVGSHPHYYPHSQHDFRGDIYTPMTPFTSVRMDSSTSTPTEHFASSHPSLFAAPSLLDACCISHGYPASGPSWYPSVRGNDAEHASMEAPITCQWQTEGGTICGLPISVARCPEHLATAHGISKMALDFKVTCRWCPDGSRPVKRVNIVRHVRESHLHHTRRTSRLRRSVPA